MFSSASKNPYPHKLGSEDLQSLFPRSTFAVVFRFEIPQKLSQVEWADILHYLSEKEKTRAAEYLFEADQIRFAVCRFILRRVLSGYLGIFEKEIVIATDRFGRPYLMETESIDFNISHSGSESLIVISDGRVGIDLEEKKRGDSINTNTIWQTCFGESEWALLNCEFGSKERAWIEGFCRKEAVLKYLGAGLSRMKEVRIWRDRTQEIHVAANGRQIKIQVETLSPLLNGQYSGYLALDAGEGRTLPICFKEIRWNEIFEI